MRVGVYADGFNLYKRGHDLAGHAAGWKWLDIRALAATLAADEWAPGPHTIDRVVYCTSRVNPTPSNPDGPRRQETFINALRASRSVDWIEYRLFMEKVKTRPLALRNRRGKPVLIHPSPPVLVKDGADQKVSDATFYVSVADREEKGSDVNIATHLLLDVLADPPVLDAAISRLQRQRPQGSRRASPDAAAGRRCEPRAGLYSRCARSRPCGVCAESVGA